MREKFATLPTFPPHTRTAKIALGYSATFRMEPSGELSVEWKPRRPVIESARAWRKFFAAYQAERDAFLAEVATMIGGPVGVTDPVGASGDGRPELTVIQPGVRH